MADYFAYWLETGKRLASPVRIFRVNWFRRDASGRFLWPGYGENVRVLKWIVERITGKGEARETPIGLVPTPDALDLGGLDISRSAVEAALEYERDGWLQGLGEQRAFFEQFGERLPAPIWDEHERMTRRLSATAFPSGR
jgi:phosphoenolpyruvate carboxykinase (GTP)